MDNTFWTCEYLQVMTDLRRLESPDGDPRLGGFVISFPSGAAKAVAWATGAPISPTLEASKEYAAKVIEDMSRSALYDDMERTNWASCVAAIQRILDEFNERLRAHLFATGPELGREPLH